MRSGTAADVDAALGVLKKNNGSIDVRNAFGSTALHIAVWRNHIPIMRKLLAAGADTDIRVINQNVAVHVKIVLPVWETLK